MEEFYHSSDIEPTVNRDPWPIVCARPDWWRNLPTWDIPPLDQNEPMYQVKPFVDFLTGTKRQLSGFYYTDIKDHPSHWPEIPIGMQNSNSLVLHIGKSLTLQNHSNVKFLDPSQVLNR